MESKQSTAVGLCMTYGAAFMDTWFCNAVQAKVVAEAKKHNYEIYLW